MKILDDFEPYNDIWYKSCFFHAFFPVIRHFNRDILPFISNEIFIYEYNETKTDYKLGMKVFEKNSVENILESMDINVMTKVETNDIIGNLISSIDNERPVIIFIDCYYESIRPDAFQKNHFPHTLLIYGYNNIDEMFYILEHKYRDSYLYEKRTISYSDVVNCYNGFIVNLKKDKNPLTYFEYSIKSNDQSSEKNNLFKRNICLDAFYENLQENKKTLYNGIEDLKLFINDYRHIVFEESLLKKNVDDLLNAFNGIINNKNLERYCVLKIFNSNYNSINLCESIINSWSFIRGIIGKYKFSSQYNLKSFEKSIEKLNEIYDLECRWYDSLFYSYDQMRDYNE